MRTQHETTYNDGQTVPGTAWHSCMHRGKQKLIFSFKVLQNGTAASSLLTCVAAWLADSKVDRNVDLGRVIVHHVTMACRRWHCHLSDCVYYDEHEGYLLHVHGCTHTFYNFFFKSEMHSVLYAHVIAFTHTYTHTHLEPWNSHQMLMMLPHSKSGDVSKSKCNRGGSLHICPQASAYSGAYRAHVSS